MKDKRRDDGYKKWNGTRSRDDKAERFASRHMTSTLLSLTFNKYSQELQENKNGMCVYDGSALTFPEWEFKVNTQIRAYCTQFMDKPRRTTADGGSAETTPQKSDGSYEVAGKADASAAADVSATEIPVDRVEEIDWNKYKETMSRVINALKGEAFTVARELDTKALFECGSDFDDEFCGHNRLIAGIRKMAFPTNEHEAKTILRHFIQPGGILARQSSEPMHHYIMRRTRTWNIIKQLDPAISLSSEHRADMLLDNAGLTRDERTCITSSINNSRDYGKISEALQKQHHQIHTRDIKRREERKDKKPYDKKSYDKKPYYKYGSNRGMVNKKKYVKTGNAAVMDSDDEFETVGYNADTAYIDSDEISSADSASEPENDAYTGQPLDWDSIKEDMVEMARFFPMSPGYENMDDEEYIELEAFATVAEALGETWMDDPDITEGQCHYFVHMMDNAKAKVRAQKGKGKGKGKGVRQDHSGAEPPGAVAAPSAGGRSGVHNDFSAGLGNSFDESAWQSDGDDFQSPPPHAKVDCPICGKDISRLNDAVRVSRVWPSRWHACLV